MKYLVIGPGGQNFFSYLGVLKYMEKEIQNIEEISGTSSGSLISFFLCINKSIDEIIEFGFEINQNELGKFKLKNLFTKFGLIDTENARDKIIELAGINPTFKELQKKLYVGIYNLNFQKTEYFSRDTHPDMHVIDAICMSMSIPILMTSMKYNDCYYIDGGFLDKFPLYPFMNKNVNDVFIIKTIYNVEPYTNIKTFKQFITSIMLKCITSAQETYKYSDYKFLDVPFLEGISSIDLNLDTETKWKLFLNGYSVAENYK